MRVALIILTGLTGLALLNTTATAASLTEQEARLKAAEWIQDRAIHADPAKPGPAAKKSVFEILSHIREGLLVVRGNTGYCGVIRKRTWILILDEEGRSWNGGNPVMINAHTGKILDCRS